MSIKFRSPETSKSGRKPKRNMQMRTGKLLAKTPGDLMLKNFLILLYYTKRSNFRTLYLEISVDCRTKVYFCVFSFSLLKTQNNFYDRLCCSLNFLTLFMSPLLCTKSIKYKMMPIINEIGSPLKLCTM